MPQLAKRSRLALASATVFASSMLAPFSLAQSMTEALNQVPANAEMVLVVPSASKLSQAVTRFNRELGLNQPELNNILAMAKAMGSMNEGFNDDGSVILVFSNVAEAIRHDDEPDMTFLFPASDANALVQSMGGQADGVSAIFLGNEEAFAKTSGAYVVVADNEATAANYQAANAGQAWVTNLGQYAGQFNDQALAMGWINTSALAEVLQEKLDEGVAELSEIPPHQAAQLPWDPEEILTGFAGMGESLIHNTQALAISLDMANNGVGLNYALKFKPGSDLAKLMPGNANSAATNLQLLNQLPKQNALMTMSMDLSALDVPLMLDWFDGVMGMFGDSDFSQGLQGMMQQAAPIYDNVEGAAQMLCVMSMQDLMGGGLKAVTVAKVKDSNKYAQDMEAFMTGIGDSMSQMMAGAAAMNGGQGPAMDIKTSYMANFMQVEGYRVDHFSMEMEVDPETMQQMQMMNPMAGMFTKSSGFIAYVGPNTVVATSVPDEGLIRTAILSAVEKRGLGTNQALQQAHNNLMDNATAELFIPLNGIAEMVGTMMMGDPAAIPVPENLPPIAMGFGVKNGEAAVRFFVPMDTIKFGMQTGQSFMGGVGGPGSISAPVQQ